MITTATRAVSAPITVGDGPFRVAINAPDRTVYVTNYSGGTVSVITTAAHGVTATIPVGSGPDGVAITPRPGPST